MQFAMHHPSLHIPPRADSAARLFLFATLPAAAAAGAHGLPALLALAGLLSLRPSLLRQAIDNVPIYVVFLFLFVTWAAIASLWSPVAAPTQAIKLILTLALGLMFVAAAGAEPGARRLTRAASIAAFTVLCALLALEASAGLPLNRSANPDAIYWVVERNPARGAVVLLGLVWPLAAGAFVSGRPRLGLATLAAGGYFAFQFDQHANTAAFGLGLAGFAFAYLAPRAALLLSSFGLAAWMLAAPFLTPLLAGNQDLVGALPESLAHRASIWSYVCERIAERPWLGHGMDASRTVTDTIIFNGQAVKAIPLHPHSGSLQIWYENGLVGALLAAGALAFGGIKLASMFANNRAAAAACSAVLLTYGVLANVSFGVWQEWWNAAMLLAAAVIAGFAPPSDYGAGASHAAKAVRR